MVSGVGAAIEAEFSQTVSALVGSAFKVAPVEFIFHPETLAQSGANPEASYPRFSPQTWDDTQTAAMAIAIVDARRNSVAMLAIAFILLSPS